jgi:biotin-dependent carboxylase-like uncharacterized protein
MDRGFSPSGAMDKKSLAIANILVGNAPYEAAIETTLTGLTAEFTSEAIFAITGADVLPELNGERIAMYAAYKAKAGDTLRCGAARIGLRTYFAFAGGLDIPSVLKSKSTNLKCKLGGYQGSALKAGDEIPFLCARPVLRDMMMRGLDIELSGFSEPIRVVMGPQNDYFTDDGIGTFLSSPYQVTMDSDRMGIKLDGPAVSSKAGVDIISDGIPLGGIQIPSNGKPIIMMADRQTTGGYAKIATVITADVNRVAQFRPGDRLKFTKISLKEAQDIYRYEAECLKKLEKLWKK